LIHAIEVKRIFFFKMALESRIIEYDWIQNRLILEFFIVFIIIPVMTFRSSMVFVIDVYRFKNY
jgi:hypothetical protein